MKPFVCRARHLTRRLTHGNTRRLIRRIGRGPRANHLGQALGAFTRAVRAHRKLIKLAPQFFDAAVARRKAADRAEREALHAEAIVALEKVYGSDPPELHRSPFENRCSNGAETVQFSRRTETKIEFLSAELSLWLETGRVAFARHQHLRPHRLLPLGTLARMVDLAAQLGRLACGLPWPGRRPPRPPEDFSLEAVPVAQALARCYGEGPG